MSDAEPYRHRPRKRFGQNFLTDQTIVEDIVGAIRPASGDHLVEIGPGLGALTERLAESGARLTLVELDRDLVAELQRKFGNHKQISILSADALKTDFRSICAPGKGRILGNLPYNISTPLLFHLMDQLDAIQDMHFMLQKEVVQRITSAPNSRHWGRLGVMLQFYCTTEKVLEVPPTAFNPPPKVDSAVVRLVPRNPLPTGVDPARLEEVVRTAFNNRRKNLRNCLKTLISAEDLQQLGIDPLLRPENLGKEEFLRITRHLEQQ